MAETEELSVPGEGPDVPKKKKTSVKVVRRVKSKKSEKGELPELKPPSEDAAPAVTVDEPVAAAAPEPSPAAPEPAAPLVHRTSTKAVSSSLEAAAPRRISSSKKRAARSGSNVFSMFSQHQIQQFKEAFGFIDQDKDGIISRSDIRATFDALGRLCTDKELDEMTREASGPINFTMFLTVFGDRIEGTDDEDIILNAFNLYDEGDGFCDENKLRHALMTWGQKFTKQECDVILQEAPVDSRGRIDIKRFATLVTRGAEEDEAQ